MMRGHLMCGHAEQQCSLSSRHRTRSGHAPLPNLLPWQDVERAKDALRPIMESHVGGRLAEEERDLLAFTAIKPALTSGA